jgi:hypothetical protein
MRLRTEPEAAIHPSTFSLLGSCSPSEFVGALERRAPIGA